MAPGVALTYFLFIVSQQVASAWLIVLPFPVPVVVPITEPGSLQPAASPNQDPGSGSSTIGNAWSMGNCQWDMEKLYINLFRGYDVLYEMSEIGTQMQLAMIQCTLPPYTAPEKITLCLEEAAKAYQSQTVDVLGVMAGVVPQILANMEKVQSCVKSLSLVPGPL